MLVILCGIIFLFFLAYANGANDNFKGVATLFASKLSLPVSTTHVPCGSLFGIGIVTGQARPKTIASILVAWVTTLPVAAALGALRFLF